MKIIGLFIIMFLFLSQCATQKQQKTMENTKELIEQGFVKVEVVQQEASTCTKVLKLEDGTLVDPINYNEEIRNIETKEIWVKLQYLRRANRCPEANPVNIIEVKPAS